MLTLLHSLSRSRALHQHDCAFRRDRQGAPSQVSHREGLHASTHIAHLVSVAAPGAVLGASERLSRPDKVSSENPATYSSRDAEPQCRATPEWAQSYGNEPMDAGDARRSVLEGLGSCDWDMEAFKDGCRRLARSRQRHDLFFVALRVEMVMHVMQKIDNRRWDQTHATVELEKEASSGYLVRTHELLTLQVALN